MEISWNKYRSRIPAPPRSSNLDYTIDPAFKNINGLFVQSFNINIDDHDFPGANYFDKYYMLLVEIKDFNALIDNKLWKANKKHTKNLLKCQENITIQQETY